MNDINPRLSFSILNMWKRGYKDDALRLIWGLEVNQFSDFLERFAIMDAGMKNELMGFAKDWKLSEESKFYQRYNDLIDLVRTSSMEDNLKVIVEDRLTIEYKRNLGKMLHQKIATDKIKVLDFFDDTWIFEDYEKGINKYEYQFMNEGKPFFKYVVQIDALSPEQKALVDFKSGTTPIADNDENQIYGYDYILSLNGISTTKGHFVKIEPTPLGVEATEYTWHEFTKRTRQQAEEFIMTFASEIYHELSTYNKA